MAGAQVFNFDSDGDPYEELGVSILIQAIEDYRANRNVVGSRRCDIEKDLEGHWLWEHFLPNMPFATVKQYLQ